MSNEELAQRIQAGETGLIPELWERNKKLFSLLAWKYYNRKEELCKKRGVTLEDLKQCGYFAMLGAVGDYYPESGYKFTSFVRFHTLNQYNGIMGLRTRRQTKEPLNTAEALEDPLPGEEDITLLDNLEDEQAALVFRNKDKELSFHVLCSEIDRALKRVTPRQRKILAMAFWQNMSYRQIGEIDGSSPENIRQQVINAIQKLRHDSKLQTVYKDFFTDF